MSEHQTILFEEIKKILPHRYPFLLIDRVLQIRSDSVLALKNVSANEPFFNGHFPQLAIMPGVLQIEAMAQAAGLLLNRADAFDKEKDIGFLAGVDNAKFKRIVTPGDQLIIAVSMIAMKKNVLKVEAKTTVENAVASMATITLVIQSK